MRRMLAASLLLVLSSTALAGRVHVKGGGKSPPVFTAETDTVSYRVCLTGLGNGDLFVDLDAVGTAETECENPAGNVAPGQDDTVAGSGGLVIPQEEIKNGNVCFTVETEPVDDSQLDPDTCPNEMWDPHIVSVDWTSAVVTVVQGDTAQSGDVVFEDSTSF